MNRHSTFEPEGFSYHLGFSRLAWTRSRILLVWGLDYPFVTKWCPRGDSNSHILSDNRFSYHFGFHRPVEGSWSGLSLHHRRMPLGAARLVSTPSRFRAWLGISSEAFPEFEQFYSRRFHRGTQVFGLSLPRLPIPPQGHISAYSVGSFFGQRKSADADQRRYCAPLRVFRTVRTEVVCPPSRVLRSLRSVLSSPPSRS